MTKIHRQPKQPKRPTKKRVTEAMCRELAESIGRGLGGNWLGRAVLGDRRWYYLSTQNIQDSRYIYVQHHSRSAALRIMYAALLAMREEAR